MTLAPPAPSADGRQEVEVRILRLCSVFEPPDLALSGTGPMSDPIGGMQTHTAELTRALDEHGHAQIVVTAHRAGAPTRARLGQHTTVLRLGLPVRHLRQGYAIPAARAVTYAARRADVLHAHLGEDLAIVPIAVAATRLHSVPLVLTVHSSLAHTFRGPGLRSYVLKELGGRLERYGTGVADAVIVLTHRLAATLVADGLREDRVHIIPSGVSRSLFTTTDDTDPLAGIPRPRVLFLGRLHWQKGSDVLVRAAAMLRRRDAQLVLVGDGPARAQIERIAANLGITDRVHIRGFVPHRRVTTVLRGADLLVLPSRYEELGTVLVEAMSVGVPIVASDTGGIPSLIESGVNGILVPPDDPPALAAAIEKLLDDPALAIRLAAAGKLRAEEFSWDDLALRVHAVYEQAIHRRREATGQAVMRH